LYDTNVSEEQTASTFRSTLKWKQYIRPRCCCPPNTTQCHKRDGHNQKIHNRESFKSHFKILFNSTHLPYWTILGMVPI